MIVYIYTLQVCTIICCRCVESIIDIYRDGRERLSLEISLPKIQTPIISSVPRMNNNTQKLIHVVNSLIYICMCKGMKVKSERS